MASGRGLRSVLGKIGVVLSIIVFFFFGLLGTVYLSLRTPEVKVPDITGKDRYTAEAALENAGLKLRVRGTTPSLDQKPDTILNQVPEPGQVVKSGIEIAVQVSRAPKEGENVASSAEEPKQENKNQENQNTNQSPTTNQNQNQNKPKKNKNSNNANNKNSNNSNNANNANANRNANNKNSNNANTHNANTSNGNRTTNSTPTPNVNRSNPTNTNKRPPATTGTNKATP